MCVCMCPQRPEKNDGHPEARRTGSSSIPVRLLDLNLSPPENSKSSSDWAISPAPAPVKFIYLLGEGPHDIHVLVRWQVCSIISHLHLYVCSRDWGHQAWQQVPFPFVSHLPSSYVGAKSHTWILALHIHTQAIFHVLFCSRVWLVCSDWFWAHSVAHADLEQVAKLTITKELYKNNGLGRFHGQISTLILK